MIAYCDGACRVSNPGICSCAFVICITNGEDDMLYYKYEHKRYLGPELHTNNFAEYNGLLDLLKWAEESGVHDLDIRCDSQLIVKQVNGVWGVKHEELRSLHTLATALMIRGGHTLNWVRGHNGDPGNEFVDKLCNEVLDEKLGTNKK